MKHKDFIANDNWVDFDWGGIAMCEALPISDTWPWNKGTCVPNLNPASASCNFEVRYQNGNVVQLNARGLDILVGKGFSGVVRDGDKWEAPPGEVNPLTGQGPCFFHIRLIGTVAEALEKGNCIPSGPMAMLIESDARKVLRRMNIPLYPVEVPAEEQEPILKEWQEKWCNNGVCIKKEDIWSGTCVTKTLFEEMQSRIAQEESDND